MGSVCPQCSTAIAQSALFCPACGSAIRSNVVVPPQQHALNVQRQAAITRDDQASRRDQYMNIAGLAIPVAILTSIALTIGDPQNLNILSVLFLTFGCIGVTIVLGCAIRLWQLWHEQPYSFASLQTLHLFRKYERQIDGKTVYMLEFGGAFLATDPTSYNDFEPETRYRVGSSAVIPFLTYAEPDTAPDSLQELETVREQTPVYVPLQLAQKFHLFVLRFLAPVAGILGMVGFVGWLAITGKIPAPWNIIVSVLVGCSLLLIPSIARDVLGDLFSGVAHVSQDHVLDKYRELPIDDHWRRDPDEAYKVRNKKYMALFARDGHKSVPPRLFRKLVPQQTHWIIYSPLTEIVWDIVPIEPPH